MESISTRIAPVLSCHPAMCAGMMASLVPRARMLMGPGPVYLAGARGVPAHFIPQKRGIAMIQFEHVSKRFVTGAKAVEAVKDVSLHIPRGAIAGIIGFSGAGKSTLARCVNLLERPTSGRVVVGGVDLTGLGPAQLRRRREKIGMIFQQFNLFQSRTVYGNVAYPLRRRGISRQARA